MIKQFIKKHSFLFAIAIKIRNLKTRDLFCKRLKINTLGGV